MSFLHLGLLFVLISVWGFNFVVIKIGLDGISPVLLCCVRFFLTSIPFIFFTKRPKADFKKIISYGLIMFALQFSLLFVGMKVGVAPGLASLLLQVQVFFTIALAILFFDEKLTPFQIIGSVLAVIGIYTIWHHTKGELTMLGFFFVIGAALFWSIGNAISKTIPKQEMFPLVIWGSFFAWPPLFVGALFLDGPSAVLHSLYHIHYTSLLAVAYIAYCSTLFGFFVWNSLLHRYSLATMAPFTLLVPIVAMFSSNLYFNEPFPLWKMLAGLAVLSGLIINSLGPRLFQKKFP